MIIRGMQKMNDLIKNTSGIAGRFTLIIAITFIVCLIGMYVTGIENFSGQCKIYWMDPMAIAGEIIQNIPVLGKIPGVKYIVDTYFSWEGAVNGGNVQNTLFHDIFFVVLSSLILSPMLYMYNAFKDLVGKIRIKLLAGICDVFNIFLLVIYGTGIVIVVKDWVAQKLFNNNYVTAFAVLLGIQIVLSVISTIFTPKDEKKSGWQTFLDIAGNAFLDLLFVAIMYLLVISGAGLLTVGFGEPILIVGFIVCIALLFLILKYRYKLFRKNHKY